MQVPCSPWKTGRVGVNRLRSVFRSQLRIIETSGVTFWLSEVCNVIMHLANAKASDVRHAHKRQSHRFGRIVLILWFALQTFFLLGL